MRSPSLEEELHKHLKELHLAHTAGALREVDPKELDQMRDMFETQWLDKFEDLEREAVRNIKPNMEVLLAAQDVEMQREQAARLGSMRTREAQLGFWEHRERGDLEADPKAIELAREQVQERFSNLRDTMQQAVQDIAVGKEPDLSTLIENKVDKENALASALEKIGQLQRIERDQDRER